MMERPDEQVEEHIRRFEQAWDSLTRERTETLIRALEAAHLAVLDAQGSQTASMAIMADPRTLAFICDAASYGLAHIYQRAANGD